MTTVQSTRPQPNTFGSKPATVKAEPKTTQAAPQAAQSRSGAFGATAARKITEAPAFAKQEARLSRDSYFSPEDKKKLQSEDGEAFSGNILHPKVGQTPGPKDVLIRYKGSEDVYGSVSPGGVRTDADLKRYKTSAKDASLVIIGNPAEVRSGKDRHYTAGVKPGVIQFNASDVEYKNNALADPYSRHTDTLARAVIAELALAGDRKPASQENFERDLSYILRVSSLLAISDNKHLGVSVVKDDSGKPKIGIFETNDPHKAPVIDKSNLFDPSQVSSIADKIRNGEGVKDIISIVNASKVKGEANIPERVGTVNYDWKRNTFTEKLGVFDDAKLQKTNPPTSLDTIDKVINFPFSEIAKAAELEVEKGGTVHKGAQTIHDAMKLLYFSKEHKQLGLAHPVDAKRVQDALSKAMREDPAVKDYMSTLQRDHIAKATGKQPEQAALDILNWLDSKPVEDYYNTLSETHKKTFREGWVSAAGLMDAKATSDYLAEKKGGLSAGAISPEAAKQAIGKIIESIPSAEDPNFEVSDRLLDETREIIKLVSQSTQRTGGAVKISIKAPKKAGELKEGVQETVKQLNAALFNKPPKVFDDSTGIELTAIPPRKEGPTEPTAAEKTEILETLNGERAVNLKINEGSLYLKLENGLYMPLQADTLTLSRTGKGETARVEAKITVNGEEVNITDKLSAEAKTHISEHYRAEQLKLTENPAYERFNNGVAEWLQSKNRTQDSLLQSLEKNVPNKKELHEIYEGMGIEKPASLKAATLGKKVLGHVNGIVAAAGLGVSIINVMNDAKKGAGNLSLNDRLSLAGTVLAVPGQLNGAATYAKDIIQKAVGKPQLSSDGVKILQQTFGKGAPGLERPALGVGKAEGEALSETLKAAGFGEGTGILESAAGSEALEVSESALSKLAGSTAVEEGLKVLGSASSALFAGFFFRDAQETDDEVVKALDYVAGTAFTASALLGVASTITNLVATEEVAASVAAYTGPLSVIAEAVGLGAGIGITIHGFIKENKEIHKLNQFVERNNSFGENFFKREP